MLNVPWLAGERSIALVLNDFQPELILLKNIKDAQFAGYVVSGFFRWPKWDKGYGSRVASKNPG